MGSHQDNYEEVYKNYIDELERMLRYISSTDKYKKELKEYKKNIKQFNSKIQHTVY